MDNGNWINPVHLDPPINSKADDFGLITDKNMEQGYFTSTRDRSDDIFRFKTDIYAFYNCDSLKKNYYCFLFYDESFMDIDTLPLSYEWNFGDGERVKGIEAEHCFPGYTRQDAGINRRCHDCSILNDKQIADRCLGNHPVGI